MGNRFLDLRQHLGEIDRLRTMGAGPMPFVARAASRRPIVRALSASQRALVVLSESGGDAGVDRVVEELVGPLDLGASIREDVRRTLAESVRNASGASQALASAKPDFYGDVVVLENTAGLAETLRDTLVRLSGAGRIVDVLALTRGGDDFVALAQGQRLDAAALRAIKAANSGRPLRLRGVYMVGASGTTLNPIWLELGAKASAGALRHNHLPATTTHFFLQEWKAGRSFHDAVASAYAATVELLQPVLRVGPESLRKRLSELVLDIAPVIAGDGGLTIASDELTVAQSARSFAYAIVPAAAALAIRERRATFVVSDQGLELIASLEGDPDDTTALQKELGELARSVDQAMKTDLEQHQFDALVSFAYNIGARAFLESTLLRKLNAGDYDAVPAELKKWIHANGAVLAGLERRRAVEAKLFTDGVYDASLVRAQSAWARSFTLAKNQFDIDEAQKVKKVFQNLASGCGCITAAKQAMAKLLKDKDVEDPKHGVNAGPWMTSMHSTNRAEAEKKFNFLDSKGKVIGSGSPATPVKLEKSVWDWMVSDTSGSKDDHYAMYVMALCDGYHVAWITIDRWHDLKNPIARWSDQTGNHGPNHWEKMVGKASGHPATYMGDADPRGLDEYIEYAVPVFWHAFAKKNAAKGIKATPIVQVWRVRRP
jgi:GH24 family phage-related lysozyme (muramidase)